METFLVLWAAAMLALIVWCAIDWTRNKPTEHDRYAADYTLFV